MAVTPLFDQGWRRFHDPEATITTPGATVFCVDGADSIIGLCLNRPANTRFKAAGSHWALSEATVSDGAYVETSWPGPENVPRHSGFDVDLNDLISDDFRQFLLDNPPARPDQLTNDPCLRDGPGGTFVVHIKAGTRLYDAYSLLDRSPTVITALAAELNANLAGGENHDAYVGPWAFQTMGGAGGQTVFGALTTGTHGGDFHQRPIADQVVALHLVVDGGAHFWIEPRRTAHGFRVTDDDRLNQHYADLVPGAPFEIIRDDDVFFSVIVGGGRFGVVSSIVVEVVPQYSLHEHRRLDRWSRVKSLLKSDTQHHRFGPVHFAGTASEQITDRQEFTDRFGNPQLFRSRFLQIAINLSPDGNNERLCGVTQRWFYPEFGAEARDPNGNLRGREERGTASVAGQVGSYEPPDDTSKSGGNSTFISRACSNGNFVAGLYREAARELRKIVDDGAVPAAGIAVGALAIGAGAAVLAIAGICPILAAVAILLDEIADDIEESGNSSFATAINSGVDAIMDNPLIPHDLGVMILRSIFNIVFSSQQGKRDFVALSYAVMDTHDYLDHSCYGNAESIEVFFDATRPDLYCAYVDEIVSFEAFQQEQRGVFSVGYVSLRYVQGSRALIAPSRFDETLVVEVAALRDAAGSVDFVMNAAAVARKRIFNASLHWGQFNPLERHEVERHFGSQPGSRLGRWRQSLDRLVSAGDPDAFSSDFTRRTGLEP